MRGMTAPSKAKSNGSTRDGTKRRRWRSIIPFVLVLVLWQVASMIVRRTMLFGGIMIPGIDTMLLKDLPEIATLWGGLHRSVEQVTRPSYVEALRVICYHSSFTLFRVFGGTAIGLTFGIAVGLIVAYSATIRKLIMPSITVVRMVPLLALAAMFIIWFGGAELGSYVYVAYGVFVTIVVYVLNAINNFPPIYQQLAATLGADKQQTFWKVIVPGILPELTAGLKVSVGFAWAIDLGGEYLAVKAGLGRMILIAEWFFQTGKMIILLSLIVLYAVLGNYLITWLCNRFTKWVPRRAM